MAGGARNGVRGGQGLARVAVVVRAGAAPLFWCGVLAAAAGLAVGGLTGRRIGLLGGVVLYVLAALVVATVHRSRYTHRLDTATKAARGDILQDRAVTVRGWRRGHRWWLVLAFLAALGSAFAAPAAGGLLLAGCGSGLWLKAHWIGRRERAADVLVWLRVDWLGPRFGNPAGKRVKGYRTTGPRAGDAAPGGARRR
ncbi:hypothetical protein AB0J21_06065 [Streptomyces sp. NPDC049954]|uniref:hypothetical protein n=1 Tax=Streptomyces sp. NPDC049954 TaxID=3155779 RepID=UPI00342F3CF9